MINGDGVVDREEYQRMVEDMAKLRALKEEEAEKVKHEVRIIWGDYFKSPQIEAFPEIHELAHKIMMKASACKQGTKRSDGEELLDLVNRFAEIFWATKNVETAKKSCPYPPELPTVYPVL